MTRPFLIAALLLVPAGIAVAQVTDVGPDGFVTERTVTIAADSETVWAAFLQIERWWHPDHTISGASSNLRLEPRALGCFCESLPNDGEFVHMQLVLLDPPGTARFIGGLGPLQELPVAGAMTWTFRPSLDGIALTVVYRVHGRGLESWAEPVDDVIFQQMVRLGRLVEHGAPED